MKRFIWTPENVSATNSAARSIRTYIEQRDLRQILSPLGPFDGAAEVGCGFGRMLPVLGEFASRVVGFEREPAMVEAARRLLPWAVIIQPKRITDMQDDNGLLNQAFDFVMTFTVLQHLSDRDARDVLNELQRLSRRYVLLAEDTDPGYAYSDKRDPSHFTFGRSVETYEAMMAPFRLVAIYPREVEPGYKGRNPPIVGHYMLFEVSE